MKKGDIIYCIDESVYSNHITKRKNYIISDDKTVMVRIINNKKNLFGFQLYRLLFQKSQT